MGSNMTPTDSDVIVVGGGGSGLAAALSAVEHGARVILLERQPQLGGTTGIAVGSFTANRTGLQTAAGIDDSVHAHAIDAGRFAPPQIEALNNEALRRFFLSHTAETYEWLTGMGLRFQGPNPEPPNRVPRMHNVVPGARAYIDTLASRLRRAGGTIRTGTRVTGLLWDGPRVTGVFAETDGERTELRAARGVILAAGDYANSAELIARFKGERFAAVEGINPHAEGDGHRLAEQAGAALLNMDVTYGPELRFVPPPHKTWQQRLPTTGPIAWLAGRLVAVVPQRLMTAFIRQLVVTWQHPENALFDDGAILVNRRGERSCDERHSTERDLAIAQQPDKVAYLLLDARLIERYSRWPHFVSTAPRIAYAYVADYLRLRPDIAVAAATLDDLARRRGLPAATLARTVADWNREAVARGLPPLAGDRWVLLGPARACFTTTEGGAAINERCEVLTPQGEPIPGLYAVGQNGLGGQILWGHGLHIAWALTSGRLAGAEAARQRPFGQQ
jgi:succinate dehydrogenase/fumarate reductase flavoprotein subunit